MVAPKVWDELIITEKSLETETTFCLKRRLFLKMRLISLFNLIPIPSLRQSPV